MDKVIFIKFVCKYDDLTEDVGIAINREVAEKYADDLKNEYPDAYSNGFFMYEEFYLIKD